MNDCPVTTESVRLDRASRMPGAQLAPAVERNWLTILAAFRRDDRPYYLCQVLTWGCYACLLFALMASQGQAPGGAALAAAAWTGTGLVCTHIFRTFTRKHPLRGGPELAVRLGLATFLIAAAMVAAQT